jgi:signal transduction histidine kinase
MIDKILVVDDEEGICRVLCLSLTEVGHKVLTASQGKDALTIVRNEAPSVVLADIKMPGMDGIELLRKIKEENPDTEVIMMTGHADIQLAIRSLQFEAADFIIKPVHFDAVEVALKRAEERIWMRNRLREYTEGLEKMVSEKTRQLIEAERLAAMGQTVAAIAHAVKNIIGGLKGGMYVLEQGIHRCDKNYLHQGWEMIKGNVEKISKLALNLLKYSKEREPDYDLCDPNVPAREVFHLMKLRAQEASVTLELDLDESLEKAVFDPGEIHSCLLNLVTNAIDACANGECRAGTATVILRSAKAEGWAVEYQVRDNGCGMSEETQNNVFRSFFSTKGSKGTGLGLMISQKIVTEHEGTIHLQSTPGAGTAFVVRLPRRDMPPGTLASERQEMEDEDLL